MNPIPSVIFIRKMVRDSQGLISQRNQNIRSRRGRSPTRRSRSRSRSSRNHSRNNRRKRQRRSIRGYSTSRTRRGRSRSPASNRDSGYYRHERGAYELQDRSQGSYDNDNSNWRRNNFGRDNRGNYNDGYQPPASAPVPFLSSPGKGYDQNHSQSYDQNYDHQRYDQNCYPLESSGVVTESSYPPQWSLLSRGYETNMSLNGDYDPRGSSGARNVEPPRRAQPPYHGYNTNPSNASQKHDPYYDTTPRASSQQNYDCSITEMSPTQINGLLEEPLNIQMGAMIRTLCSLKSELCSLKSEVGSLKSEVGSLKSEVGSLNSKLDSMFLHNNPGMDQFFERLLVHQGNVDYNPTDPDPFLKRETTWSLMSAEWSTGEKCCIAITAAHLIDKLRHVKGDLNFFIQLPKSFCEVGVEAVRLHKDILDGNPNVKTKGIDLLIVVLKSVPSINGNNLVSIAELNEYPNNTVRYDKNWRHQPIYGKSSLTCVKGNSVINSGEYFYFLSDSGEKGDSGTLLFSINAKNEKSLVGIYKGCWHHENRDIARRGIITPAIGFQDQNLVTVNAVQSFPRKRVSTIDIHYRDKNKTLSCLIENHNDKNGTFKLYPYEYSREYVQTMFKDRFDPETGKYTDWALTWMENTKYEPLYGTIVTVRPEMDSAFGEDDANGNHSFDTEGTDCKKWTFVDH